MSNYSNNLRAQKAYYGEKQRTITYDLWNRFYLPMGELEPVLSENSLSLEQLRQENRVWTEYSSGSHFYIAPGIGWVDRVAYYVTEKPCNINVTVEDPQSELCLNISSEDAKAFLLKLDRQDFSFKEIWYERQLTCDNWIIDDYRDAIVALTRKYQRPLADIIELNW